MATNRLTNAQKRAARNAAKTIGWLDEAMNELCDDPMTAAYGAPVGDFFEAWSRQYRCKLAACLKDDNTPSTMRDRLLQEMEQFMP